MAARKITYLDKTNIRPITDRTKQATAEDFQDIKDSHNELAELVDMFKANTAVLVVGENQITFIKPYPVGIAFEILIHLSYDSKGYLTSHTTSAKDRFGFKVTVTKAGNFTYYTAPKT